MLSHWLQSEKASRLFLYSAWIIVCVGIFMAFMMTSWFAGIEALHGRRFLLRLLGGTLGIVGAPAALVIWFGMAAFCARVDRSTFGTKTLWFIVFLVTAWFGAVIYFFAVYRKTVQLAVPA